MDIEKLRSFLAVAREGNFSRAARARQLSQSAVSLHLQALEEELGVRLFHRLPRQSLLTNEGAQLLESATSLVEQYDRLKASFDDTLKSGAGRVRLAASNSMILYYLPTRIQQFLERYPQVDVTILPGRRQDMLQMVQQGGCDFSLGAAGTVPRSLRFHEVLRSDIILIAAKSHPLSALGPRKLTLSDVAHYPLVTYTDESAIRLMLDRAFEKERLKVKIALATGGAEIVKRYVEVGFGIGFVSRLALRKEDEERFCIVNMRRFFPEGRRYGVVWRPGTLTRAARRLLRIVAPMVDLRS